MRGGNMLFFIFTLITSNAFADIDYEARKLACAEAAKLPGGNPLQNIDRCMVRLDADVAAEKAAKAAEDAAVVASAQPQPMPCNARKYEDACVNQLALVRTAYQKFYDNEKEMFMAARKKAVDDAIPHCRAACNYDGFKSKLNSSCTTKDHYVTRSLVENLTNKLDYCSNPQGLKGIEGGGIALANELTEVQTPDGMELGQGVVIDQNGKAYVKTNGGLELTPTGGFVEGNEATSKAFADLQSANNCDIMSSLSCGSIPTPTLDGQGNAVFASPAPKAEPVVVASPSPAPSPAPVIAPSQAPTITASPSPSPEPQTQVAENKATPSPAPEEGANGGGANGGSSGGAPGGTTSGSNPFANTKIGDAMNKANTLDTGAPAGTSGVDMQSSTGSIAGTYLGNGSSGGKNTQGANNETTKNNGTEGLSVEAAAVAASGSKFSMTDPNARGLVGLGKDSSTKPEGLTFASITNKIGEFFNATKNSISGNGKDGRNVASVKGKLKSKKSKVSSKKALLAAQLRIQNCSGPDKTACLVSRLTGAQNGTGKAGKKFKGQTHEDYWAKSGSRLPAGVTSGREDVMSRLVHYYNEVPLDEDGFIDVHAQ